MPGGWLHQDLSLAHTACAFDYAGWMFPKEKLGFNSNEVENVCVYLERRLSEEERRSSYEKINRDALSSFFIFIG